MKTETNIFEWQPIISFFLQSWDFPKVKQMFLQATECPKLRRATEICTVDYAEMDGFLKAHLQVSNAALPLSSFSLQV
jgi:hypothetical protein